MNLVDAFLGKKNPRSHASAHTHTHARARAHRHAHTRTYARARAHAHTHVRALLYRYKIAQTRFDASRLTEINIFTRSI